MVAQARRQPDLIREPAALGSLRTYKIKKQIADIEAGAMGEAATVEDITDAMAAHESASDPHDQYVTHDPTIAAART